MKAMHAFFGSELSAAAYDWFTATAFLGRRDAIYARLARDAGVTAGDRVLDLGSGPGMLARAALPLATSSGQVIGLDNSVDMVVRAQRRGIDARLGDAANPPFAEGSFDVIVSALAIHHVEPADRDAIFARAWRLLVPGGRLLVAEFVPPFGRLGMDVARQVFHEKIADDPMADLVNRMGRAGFEQIEARNSGVLTVVRSRRPIS